MQAWAEQGRLPTIAIKEVRGATTITLDSRDLITVTKSDAIRDLRTPKEQADAWSTTIQAALEEAQTRRKPAELRRSIAVAIAIVVITGLGFWRLGRLQTTLSQHPINQLQQLLRGRVKRDGIPIQIRQVGLAIGLWILRYSWWIAAIFYISQLFPATQNFGYNLTQIIITSFSARIFPLGGEQYSLIDLLILLAGFLILVIGSTVVTNLLRTRILQFAGIGSGSQQAIATLTRYTLIALGTMVILQLWGLDLSSLALLASALGVGIGFGLQNIARDFGSGLILLFERPIQVGDFIEVGDFRGTVDRIGARSTMVKTLDQVAVIVPNSYFLENQVVNWSHDSPLSRISIPVGVSYDADPELVQTLLLQAGNNHKGVRSIPHPQVLFQGFGDSSLNFELLVWIIEPNRQPIIRSDLNFGILTLLRQHDIEIPYPQRDLHIRTGQSSLEQNTD
ncbi:MAG: mechanosensitive ion channel [Merismopedia sp. SIO2A8]|nr:mechanosensitive ion channel [Merismopedia sp. SIO2A8]